MTTNTTEDTSLFNIGDLILGISDHYLYDILMGVVVQKKKLMGFYCYRIQWVLDASLNKVPDFDLEWVKEKEISLYKESIKV